MADKFTREFKNEFNDELTIGYDSDESECPVSFIVCQAGELGCAAGYFMPIGQVMLLRDVLTTILENEARKWGGSELHRAAG